MTFISSIVHNGVDHFPGTKPRIPNFRGGVDQVFQTLVSAANICSNLKLSTEDKTVSVTINQAMDVIKSVGHNLNKHFIPTPLKNNPVFHHLKKENHPRSLEKPDRSNQNLPPFIVPVENCLQMMMSCSITQDTNHKLNSNWNCVMCDKQITTSKGLKRHVLSIHFGEFLHYCIYCSFGRNEKHAVVSHTKSVHGMGCDYKCDKTDKCTAVFNSLFKLKRHQKYCGEEKAHACDQCNSKFMRLENLNHHIKILHTGELEKVKCDFCLRLYQSVSSYRAALQEG